MKGPKNCKKWIGEKNGVDDRGNLHPSGNQIKTVTETRRSSKEKLPGMKKPYN